jgi:hypothetical protein
MASGADTPCPTATKAANTDQQESTTKTETHDIKHTDCGHEGAAAANKYKCQNQAAPKEQHVPPSDDYHRKAEDDEQKQRRSKHLHNMNHHKAIL